MRTLYRCTCLDVPHDPFLIGAGPAAEGALRVEFDAGILVDSSGIVVARGTFTQMRQSHPDAHVITLEGYVFPGFVDTHVHLPQIRALTGIGRPLLEWLAATAIPAEEQMRSTAHARLVSQQTLSNLAATGTTSALVFGSHYAPAMDEFFTQAEGSGLRLVSGLVVSDVGLSDSLLTNPSRAIDESVDLARRCHGRGRLGYAVTPRFALSCTPAMLEACAEIVSLAPSAGLTSHVNENLAEITGVRNVHPSSTSYVDAYDRYGLLTKNTVLAHNVHPRRDELEVLASRGTTIAHCPTSNGALGSGLFPLNAHVDAGVHVALGSDVGAGAGFGILKEALQAIYVQQYRGSAVREPGSAYALTPTHVLWLSTRAGALAMKGMFGPVALTGDGQAVPRETSGSGRIEPGEPFDAVHVVPQPKSDTALAAEYATTGTELLAALMTLVQRHDVAHTWVAGDMVYSRGDSR